MSTLELSDLYQDLKRGGHALNLDSTLRASCEEELSELMKQIDIMFKYY